MFILKIKPNFMTTIHVVPKNSRYNTLIWLINRLLQQNFQIHVGVFYSIR